MDHMSLQQTTDVQQKLQSSAAENQKKHEWIHNNKTNILQIKHYKLSHSWINISLLTKQ